MIYIYELCQKSIPALPSESFLKDKGSLVFFGYFKNSVENEKGENFFKLHHFSTDNQKENYNYFFKVISIFKNTVIINKKIHHIFSFLTSFVKKENVINPFVFNTENKRIEFIFQPISFFNEKRSFFFDEETKEKEEDESSSFHPDVYRLAAGIERDNNLLVSKDNNFFTKYCINKFLTNNKDKIKNVNQTTLILNKTVVTKKSSIDLTQKEISMAFLETYFEQNSFSDKNIYEITYSIPFVMIMNNNYDFLIEKKIKEIIINKKQAINFVYNFYKIIQSFTVI